jgi:putative endonuclease
LVHFERFQHIKEAIARETQIKGWLRVKKIALIVRHNPTWRDLSEDWGKLMEPFNESKMKPPTTFD